MNAKAQTIMCDDRTSLRKTLLDSSPERNPALEEMNQATVSCRRILP
jgi:hypothetical protein